MNRLQSGKMSTPTPVSKAEVKEEVCIVCSQKKQIGLYIWGHFICRQCEKEMVETKVEDQKYKYFIEQMRKIWLQDHSR